MLPCISTSCPYRFPSLQLQRALTHNTCTLRRLCSATEKHSGDFIFTIVTPALDGYLACSELIDYLAVPQTPFTTACVFKGVLLNQLYFLTLLLRFTTCHLRLRGTSKSIILFWSWRWESNPQSAVYKAAALPLSHTSIIGTYQYYAIW